MSFFFFLSTSLSLCLKFLMRRNIFKYLQESIERNLESHQVKLLDFSLPGKESSFINSVKFKHLP